LIFAGSRLNLFEKMEEEKIITELMHNKRMGLSITEIVKLTNQSRSAVRINLARLEGANRIKSRRIGMAKVYILNQDASETQLQITDICLNPIITSKTETDSKNKMKTQLFGGI
jgi:predicted transcriptional regulator